MKHCYSYGRPFTPRQPYHRYCDSCYSDLQAERRSYTNPTLRRYPMNRLTGDGLVVTLILTAIVFTVYVILKLLGLV